MINQQPSSSRSVCKVNTQDPENFDEELKSLVTAWLTFPWCRQLLMEAKLVSQESLALVSLPGQRLDHKART